jgi:hypothetical protein
MSVLFPPPYKPLASPLDDLKIPGVTLNLVVPLIITTALHDLCPLGNPVADPPYEDHAPVAYRVGALSALGSTSANPFFANTSDSTAAQVAGQRRTLDDAQTRVAQMMSSTSAALLSSTGQ